MLSGQKYSPASMDSVTFTPPLIFGKGTGGSVALKPKVLRSGTFVQELIVPEGGEGRGRVRTLFYYGPAFRKNSELNELNELNEFSEDDSAKMCLKLLRVQVCTEVATDPVGFEPVGFEPVPPFAWHVKWGEGTSYTYTPTTAANDYSDSDSDGPVSDGSGDFAFKKWDVPVLDASNDSLWHGRPRGLTDDVWGVRVGRGGVTVHCPKVFGGDMVGIFRVGWVIEGGLGLRRAEVGIRAMVPQKRDGDGDIKGNNVEGQYFLPPQVASFRDDFYQKVGDIDVEKESIIGRL